MTIYKQLSTNKTPTETDDLDEYFSDEEEANQIRDANKSKTVTGKFPQSGSQTS